ncbi:hypothetical protein NC652_019481 [Populus alba x Populus x berolinensis]|nr:hypothetical protein NC652_019481 [Populus alba x Populus x berolinensis]
MASTPSDGEVAVFTDTNMDTHIAMGISPDITVADFKNLRPGSSGNKLETTSAVGKLMMTAANKLKISSNKQRPALSFYRFRSPSRASFVTRRGH